MKEQLSVAYCYDNIALLRDKNVNKSSDILIKAQKERKKEQNFPYLLIHYKVINFITKYKSSMHVSYFLSSV